MALIANETSFGRQLEASERWALHRWDDCDPDNLHRQKFDHSIEH